MIKKHWKIIGILVVFLLFLWYVLLRKKQIYRGSKFYEEIGYILQPECDARIIWMISSSVANKQQREIIRETHSEFELRRLNISRIFLLGRNVRSEIPSRDIKEEATQYNDILQGNFLDSYKNLTTKHLMGLSWISKECISSRYIIKSDDDIVIDIYSTLALINDERMSEKEIIGYEMKQKRPERMQENKWFVNERQFSEEFYPDFVSGWFYIAGLETARSLLVAAKTHELFWIDDVFVTGILRQSAGVKIRPINQLFATDYRYLECCVNQQSRYLACDYLVGPDGGKADLHQAFKRFLDACQNVCKQRRDANSVRNTCILKATDEDELKEGRGEAVVLKV